MEINEYFLKQESLNKTDNNAVSVVKVYYSDASTA